MRRVSKCRWSRRPWRRRAIARKPEMGYRIMGDRTCQYAAHNREFDEGEPEVDRHADQYRRGKSVSIPPRSRHPAMAGPSSSLSSKR